MDEVQQVAVADAQAAHAAGALLLDVREEDEWAAGHAPGALHVPMSQLQARLDEVPDAAVTLVICRSGGRSDTVAHAFARIGRGGCANVAGGMLAWQAAGLPVEPAGGRIL